MTMTRALLLLGLSLIFVPFGAAQSTPARSGDGALGVIVHTVPKNKIDVVRFIHAEHPSESLRHAVKALEKLPAVVFADVAADEAKRLQAALSARGCLVQIAPMAEVYPLVPQTARPEEAPREVLTLTLTPAPPAQADVALAER